MRSLDIGTYAQGALLIAFFCAVVAPPIYWLLYGLLAFALTADLAAFPNALFMWAISLPVSAPYAFIPGLLFGFVAMLVARRGYSRLVVRGTVAGVSVALFYVAIFAAGWSFLYFSGGRPAGGWQWSWLVVPAAAVTAALFREKWLRALAFPKRETAA